MPENSEIYRTDADAFFLRNVNNQNKLLAEQLLTLFPKAILREFEIAEFGCGPSHNLLLLSNFVKRVHGYDISRSSVDYLLKLLSGLPRERHDGFCVNLCKQCTFPICYDLILLGWFTYYSSNKELEEVKKNIDRAIKDRGYVFVNDFLVRSDTIEKSDAYNPNLKVYKRNLHFWMHLLPDYDLISFQLHDCGKHDQDKLKDDYSKIDTDLSPNDDDWIFTALFRRRDTK